MNTPIFSYITEPELLWAFTRLVSISSNFLLLLGRYLYMLVVHLLHPSPRIIFCIKICI